MDFNAVVQAISAVGFPIAACCVMFWELEKNGERHKQEMDTVKEALNNNTIALTRLIERMGGDDNG